MIRYSNLNPREQRDYFKRTKGRERLELSIEIVDRFINTNKFTQTIDDNTYNTSLAASVIMDNYAKGKQSHNQLCSTFNKVLTIINNDRESYNMISKELFKYRIKENEEYMYISDFIIKASKESVLFSNNPEDLFWLFRNNQIYLVLSKEHAVNNDLDTVIQNNLYGFDSVTIPLIKNIIKIRRY